MIRFSEAAQHCSNFKYATYAVKWLTYLSFQLNERGCRDIALNINYEYWSGTVRTPDGILWYITGDVLKKGDYTFQKVDSPVNEKIHVDIIGKIVESICK
jgi:hypothetical protein